MAFNPEYKVNSDGSVTKITNGGSGNRHNNSGGSSDKGGCGWFLFFCICIGAFIGVIRSACSDKHDKSDEDYSTIEEVVVEAEPYYAPEPARPSTTYLRVSTDDLYMNASGGSRDITVYCDGDWYIDVGVASWCSITRYSNSLTLMVNPNHSSNFRTDYFILKSGSYTKRVNITQYGDSSPRAEIESIWMDHNTYHNGQKGMMIHVRFTVDNLKGKIVYAYAYFYWSDNVTSLHDQYGNNLYFHEYGIPGYDNTRFDDFQIFVPYDKLNMPPDIGSVDLSYDISIRTSSGMELDRDNNTQITFSN